MNYDTVSRGEGRPFIPTAKLGGILTCFYKNPIPFAPSVTGKGEVRTMIEEDIKKILSNFKIVAVVGISPKEDRPSYIVASYLKSKGYRIIPVRPDGEEILGEKVYHRITDIPEEIAVEVVDIFRRSEDVPPIVEEAIQRRAKVVWMQEGVIHKEAGAKAEKAGLKVVMDRCIKKEHQKLL